MVNAVNSIPLLERFLPLLGVLLVYDRIKYIKAIMVSMILDI